jgi:FixJ family two-component response regulator
MVPVNPTSPAARGDSMGNSIAHHEVTRSRKSELGMVRAHIGKLTPREREVFELVIRGQTNKQVANALGATERTIKAHRHRVMAKMQTRSLAELVSLAERVDVLRHTADRRPNNSQQFSSCYCPMGQ